MVGRRYVHPNVLCCPKYKQTAQQTRDIEPMVKCWADVVDGEPTLNQHRSMSRARWEVTQAASKVRNDIV